MLIPKFDLYRLGWLELVFDRRNKEYGAYDLRRHYADNMIMAMGITFFCVALLCGASIIFRATPSNLIAIVVNNHPITPILPPVAPPIKRIEPPVSRPLKPLLPLNPPATLKNVEMVVAPDIKAVEPIKNAELTVAIGTTTTPGKGTGDNVLPGQGDGTGTQPLVDESVHTLTGLDVMPAPVGGEAAWAKLLRKNLRFPSEARDAKVSGRVILSFVIEKDGHLSNILIERGAGYGFDEEAMRVLKLAKAWTPGQQNGQPVRVKYLIPINFQMSEDER